MRWSPLVLIALCGCHKLFGIVEIAPDAAIDAAPDVADPTLTKWTAATPLPVRRDYNLQHAAVVGETLYLIGGFDVSETNVVYRASLTEGNLGEWTTTTSLPEPRAIGDVVTIDTRIFVVGGANFGGAQISVYCGEPDGAGDIPSWSSGPDLPEARKAPAATAANNFLYVVGGADGSNARQTSVFYAPVRTDCGLGSWQVTTPLPAGRANLGVVAARGFIYAIGGDDINSLAHATVHMAAQDPITGLLAPWIATTPLPIGRQAIVAVTDGSHIYVIGGVGTSATAEVRYSRIGDDGTLGPWETTEPLLRPRYRHAGVLANGHLFVFGGAVDATGVEHSSQGGL